MKVAASGADALDLVGDRLVVRPDHHRERSARSVRGGVQHMRQQRLAGDGMQHLRQRGAHARALAGREHDGQAGSSGHSLIPCNRWPAMRMAPRRLKLFSPGDGNRFAARKPPGFKLTALFLLMFAAVIRRGLEEGQGRLWPRKPDHLAGSFEAEDTGGVLSGLLAEEDEFDRRALWRLGSWGVGAVGAVIVAVMANQSSLGWRREQVAAADLARQAQQIQAVARESQSEARRLASAIETLNSDRDRLYSRVTVLEQGLDSVTGAIARQSPPRPRRRPLCPRRADRGGATAATAPRSHIRRAGRRSPAPTTASRAAKSRSRARS